MQPRPWLRGLQERRIKDVADKELTFQQARRIAARVGARIEEARDAAGVQAPTYRVTISGRSVKDLNDKATNMVFHAATPIEAAHRAIIETAKHAQLLVEICKLVYVNEDLLFRSNFHGGE